MQRCVTAMVWALSLGASAAFGQANEKTCSVAQCHSGDVVRTVAEKGDPYYACPTRELSDYTNGVLGMAAVTVVIAGRPPNISPETGEPEAQGETKAFFDQLRRAAGVRTFDEGIAKCQQGRNGIRGTVMNDGGADSMSIWIGVQGGKANFWLPSSHVDLIKRFGR